MLEVESCGAGPAVAVRVPTSTSGHLASALDVVDDPPHDPEGVVWAILLLPIASMLTIAFVTKPYPKLSGYVTIAAIGTAFLFALWALDSVIDSDGHALALRFVQLARHQHVERDPPPDWRPGPQHRSRAPHRRPERDHARRRHVGVAAGADLLAGVHGRRWRLLALLRLHVAVHRVDARPDPDRQHPHGLRLLGARRARLVPAHRLLVPQEVRRRRREEGVPRRRASATSASCWRSC